MSEEIQQAVQIIRVAYDGIEIAMKVGSGSIEQMKKALDFLIALLEQEKALGKTSMRKLLLKGGDLQVFQFNNKDMKQVEKMAKKYGILYSVLPDINKGDGKSEIIFHTEAVPRVNMMIQKLKFGRITTFDDYLKNGDEKELDKVISFLKEQKKGNEGVHTEEAVKANDIMDSLIEKVGAFAMEKQIVSVDEIRENFNINKEKAESTLSQLEKIGVLSREENGQHKVIMDKDAFEKRIRSYHELSERMRAISAAKNTNLVDITVTKKLILEENDHAIKTRIPGTWGKDACYIWTDKKDVMEIHNGKTLLTYLDKNKEYKIYSADNRVLSAMKGDTLYNNHYDSVEVEVRKRYQAAERKAAAAKQKMPAPKKR